MPAVQKIFIINAPIDSVWSYVTALGNWAALMPGYQSYAESSELDSLWTLKVDLGPFSRTIELDVQVTERQSPGKVAFSVKSRNEPFHGQGMYQAVAEGNATNVDLTLSLQGTGPMAPVLSVMADPVLKRMAESFSKSLAADIEARAAVNS